MTLKGLAACAAAAGGLLALGGAALAQPAAAPAAPAAGAEAPTKMEEITVTAPHLVKRKQVGTAKSGAPIEVLSTAKPVSFVDLDLTKPADAARFEQRIRDAAAAACNQVDSRYPSDLFVPVPSDQDCVKTAIAQTMPLAKEIIAAANAQ